MSTDSTLIRIPNLPLGQIVDEQGMPTDDELTFRQGLLTSLQKYMGTEGLVAPTQSPTNKDLIQDNVQTINTDPLIQQYTCQLGTILYVQHPTDYTQDKVMVAVRNGNDYPDSAPLFKEIQLI